MKISRVGKNRLELNGDGDLLITRNMYWCHIQGTSVYPGPGLNIVNFNVIGMSNRRSSFKVYATIQALKYIWRS